MKGNHLDYRSVGVDSVEAGLAGLAARVRKSFALAGQRGEPGAVHLDLGYYANVIEITPELGLAISTDGVGTKLLVAEMLEKFDTVGIDCVAMNVNDVLCVGARPVALVDYIAVERVDAAFLAAIADGLLRGAEEAGISIPGGELAQVKEMVHGIRPGSGFDLVGTAVGYVPLDRIIVGADLEDGDVVIGLASTGIHSNGLTLARRALFDTAGYRPDQHLSEFGRTVGEELLEPTRIYVRPVLALLKQVRQVKALAHITGDGLLNLLRVKADVSYELTDLFEAPPVFRVIQEAGRIELGEMFHVFNMGLGFVVAVAADAADRALHALQGAGAPDARVIGRIRATAPGRVILPEHGLVGTKDGRFTKTG